MSEKEINAEINAEIFRALQQLPDGSRTVLLLYDLVGLSLEEVASVQGIDLKIAKGRIYIARNRFRQLLPTIFKDQSESFESSLALKDPSVDLPPDPEIKYLFKNYNIYQHSLADYNNFIEGYNKRMSQARVHKHKKVLLQLKNWVLSTFTQIRYNSPLLVAACGILITGLFVILIYQIIYKQNNPDVVAINTDPKIIDPHPSPIPTITPSPTITPTITPTIQPTNKPTPEPGIKKPLNHNPKQGQPDPDGMSRGSEQAKQLSEVKTIYIDSLTDNSSNDELRNELINQLTSNPKFEIYKDSDLVTGSADGTLKMSASQADTIILISRNGKILWKKKLTEESSKKSLASSIINDLSDSIEKAKISSNK